MIIIETLNINSNLSYFADYLSKNYDFLRFDQCVNSLKIYFNTEPDEVGRNSIIAYYDSITEQDWIETYKERKFQQIDAKTQELISVGYTYSNKKFSLSEDAQTNILALFATKNDPVLTYPITFNTIDNLDYYDAVDANDISNMYYTALATKKAHLDSGTLLKDQIRAATSKASIDLIIDNR